MASAVCDVLSEKLLTTLIAARTSGAVSLRPFSLCASSGTQLAPPSAGDTALVGFTEPVVPLPAALGVLVTGT